MCALNIRWGRKGSIQEFSTLLWAPGLSSPSQPSQATLRTRTGWNRPPSPQQQHKQSQLRVHWLETKQCMIAKPEPCFRPLGCSHRSSCAPPCAAHLPKDSFHRNPSKLQVNDFPRWDATCTFLTPWTPKTYTFSTVAFHLIHCPLSPASFTHPLLPLAAFCISILLLIPSLTHSFRFSFFFRAQLCDMAVASPCCWGEWWLSSSLLFGLSFFKSP